MGKVVFFRFQAIVVTGIISVFAVFSSPALSQETEAGEGESILIESTIAGGVDASTAVTIEHVTIPIDELELLVKPLTIEELQVEAAAWLLLLRNKVQEISKTEIAIKRQQQAIQQAQEGAKRIQEAENQLKQAESALAAASPGTPEHEQATKKQEEAKKALQKARQAIGEALEIVEDREELEETVEEAKAEKQIATAREVLKEAKKQREDLVSGSTTYEAATQKIDALDQALIELKAAEEKLKDAVPDSDEYQELAKTLEETRATVIEATKGISDAGLAPEKAEDGASVESEDSEETLKDITGNIEDAQGENKTEEDTENTKDKAVTDSSQLAGVTSKLKALVKTQSDLKDQLTKNVTNLQGDQTKISERFKVVLDALDQKGGDTASYRTYIEAISAIKVDLTDTNATRIRILTWLTSEQGGIRWGLNLAKFVGILLVSVIVSRQLSKLTDRLLSRIPGVSSLLRQFAVMIVGRGVLIVGGLIALALLGVNLGPILALVGGASFVLAFALQNNLGNFASGLMILVTKPFDVGDEVKIGGTWAWVDSINLANTKLKGWYGEPIILPNNTVWSSQISNLTAHETRRGGFGLYFAFDADIPRACEILKDCAKKNPLVLEKPGPGTFIWEPHEYGIYVAFTFSTKTPDFWTASEQVLCEYLARFKEEGIQLAVPTQDIRALPIELMPQSNKIAQEGGTMKAVEHL